MRSDPGGLKEWAPDRHVGRPGRKLIARAGKRSAAPDRGHKRRLKRPQPAAPVVTSDRNTGYAEAPRLLGMAQEHGPKRSRSARMALDGGCCGWSSRALVHGQVPLPTARLDLNR
jgi:hypothetical protein